MFCIIFFCTGIVGLSHVMATPSYYTEQNKGRFEVIDTFPMLDGKRPIMGKWLRDRVTGKCFIYIDGSNNEAGTIHNYISLANSSCPLTTNTTTKRKHHER